MTKEEVVRIRAGITDAITLFESIWQGGSPPDMRPRVSATSIAVQLKAAADRLSQDIDKEVVLETRAAILDALAFLETLERGPDEDGGDGGLERRRAEQMALRVTWRLRAASERLGEEFE